MSEPNATKPAATPRPGCALSLVGVAATLAAHLVAIGVLAFSMIVIVPNVAEIFEDFELGLSPSTLLVIWVSDLFLKYSYLLLGALLACDLVAVLCGAAAVRLKWLASAWSHAMLLGVILFLGFTQLAVFLPLVRLFHALQ